ASARGRVDLPAPPAPPAAWVQAFAEGKTSPIGSIIPAAPCGLRKSACFARRGRHAEAPVPPARPPRPPQRGARRATPPAPPPPPRRQRRALSHVGGKVDVVGGTAEEQKALRHALAVSPREDEVMA